VTLAKQDICDPVSRVYEKIRNHAAAKEYYEKLLDGMKDADPGLPEVKDVRRRLAGLRGS
jgi:hypothetical protein